MKKHIGLCVWVELSDQSFMNAAMRESVEMFCPGLASVACATLGKPPWGDAFRTYSTQDFSLGVMHMVDVTIETEGWPDARPPEFIAWALAYNKSAPRAKRLTMTEWRNRLDHETQCFYLAQTVTGEGFLR